MSNNKNGPGVKFPPPLVFIIAIFLGYWLNNYIVLITLDSYFWLLIGSTGVIVSSGVLIYGLFSFFKARTNVELWKPDSQLITTGLYRYSRNPLYLAFFVFTLSLGLLVANFWIILFAFPALWVIKNAVILKEEKCLEENFADKYIKYKREVNRWL